MEKFGSWNFERKRLDRYGCLELHDDGRTAEFRFDDLFCAADRALFNLCGSCGFGGATSDYYDFDFLVAISFCGKRLAKYRKMVRKMERFILYNADYVSADCFIVWRFAISWNRDYRKFKRQFGDFDPRNGGSNCSARHHANNHQIKWRSAWSIRWNYQ